MPPEVFIAGISAALRTSCHELIIVILSPLFTIVSAIVSFPVVVHPVRVTLHLYNGVIRSSNADSHLTLTHRTHIFRVVIPLVELVCGNFTYHSDIGENTSYKYQCWQLLAASAPLGNISSSTRPLSYIL